MTLIQQFTKGSIWLTGAPIRIRNTAIPTGTRFEVVYPRRRESSLVAVKFHDLPPQFKAIRERRSSAPMPRRGSPQKGRFSRADAIIDVSLLETAILETTIDSPWWEYCIREIGTDKFWAGGRADPVAFYTVPFHEANQYVSAQQARMGIITMLFRHRRGIKVSENEIPFEIVALDVRTDEEQVVPNDGLMTLAWWQNVLRLSADHSQSMVFRRITNALPVDDRVWTFAAMFRRTDMTRTAWKNQKETIISKMADMGIEDFHFTNEHVVLLRHDADRVMMKLLFAEGVNIIQLGD